MIAEFRARNHREITIYSEILSLVCVVDNHMMGSVSRGLARDSISQEHLKIITLRFHHVQWLEEITAK